MSFGFRIFVALSIFAFVALVVTRFERPPIDVEQRGYRGLGMVELYNPRMMPAIVQANQIPEALPPEDPAGQKASEVYTNVQVLKDLDANEFMRLMTAMTEWVSPEQGCTYCHAEDDLAADTLYTKVVARRMLEMTQQINSSWKPHVAETGVTCFTCHRGKPVPANIWFQDPGPAHAQGFAQDWNGQNHPSMNAAGSSLPNDPFSQYFGKEQDIRVVSTSALPAGNSSSIQETEGTYGLMMHFSQALGVNCTFCHNSRSFAAWDNSTPQRATAWHGIRMVRDLNTTYLDPLLPVFPANRLGPMGDGPKLNCATCHQGVNKPLLGASMVTDYPELLGPQ